MPQTTVVFYCDDAGAAPALEWLDGVPAKALDKCRLKIERLRELGFDLRRPEADFLRDGVYELRVRLQRVNYRLLYFFHSNTSAVISHGLTKKQRVPPKEIDRALKHKERFEANPAAHTYQED